MAPFGVCSPLPAGGASVCEPGSLPPSGINIQHHFIINIDKHDNIQAHAIIPDLILASPSTPPPAPVDQTKHSRPEHMPGLGLL
ncbi:hypothetical protein MY11210_007079 [Beauveria gryllotalpidicola]